MQDFVFSSKCSGKPMEDFKQGSDIYVLKDWPGYYLWQTEARDRSGGNMGVQWEIAERTRVGSEKMREIDGCG